MSNVTVTNIFNATYSDAEFELSGLTLNKRRIDKLFTDGLQFPSPEFTCVKELLRTLHVIKAHGIDIKNSGVQVYLAPTLACCLPDGDDCLEIRQVCHLIFTDSYIIENSKTLWRRMVHPITPEWRARVKEQLKGYGWHI